MVTIMAAQLSTLAFAEQITWSGVALILGVLYYTTTSISAYWRLRHFKGPKIAAWSHLWWVRTIMSGRAHLVVSGVNTRYGPIARIAPDTLLTCDMDLYRKINSVRSGYRRSDFYQAFRFDADNENLFSETNNESHTAMRKKFSPGYTSKENARLEPDIDSVIWDLIRSWKTRYVSNTSIAKPMDLARQIQYLTLDIVTSISLGRPFGYVTTDSDVYEYIATMDANFPVMTFMSAVPLLSALTRMPFFIRTFGPSTKDRTGMGKIKAVTTKIITQRFSGNDKERGGDMTQTFIDNGATKNEIEDNVLLQILAGSDTSAAVIRMGLLCILGNPRVMKALQEEAKASGVSRNEIISNSHSLKLPYLQACVKEALRYHPGATGLFPRLVPAEGEMYNGRLIPGGTKITSCSWNMHRLNYGVYGPDANIFRPERWLEASSEDLARMEKAHELAFGHGEWKCLGYRIAMIELRKTFFELTRRFEFGIIDPKNPVASDINYGLFLQHGMWVTVSERDV